MPLLQIYDGGERRGGGGGRLLIALVVAGFSLVSYFSMRVYNPVTHETQHVGVTAEQEIALGLQAAPQMAAQYGGVDPDPQDQARVDAIGQKLLAQSDAKDTPYRFEFHALADAQTINAFALPGGQVFITAGLLHLLETEGQLAGVLGHEMGHVVARHGAQQMAKERLTQGLTGAAVLATYDPNNPASQRNAAVAALVGRLVNMRFGRQDELQADQLGVRLMAQAGYDPRAMIQVMQILEKAAPGRQVEFFSTHPNPEHRIDRIQAAIATAFPSGVPGGLKG
ncbi:MAG TPA: M48 family metallopeptidase [Thermoanaerobaculia bacterium]